MTAAEKIIEAVDVQEFDAAEFRRLASEFLSTGIAEPSIAAGQLLAELTDAQCRVALAETLPNWIRVFVGNQASTARREPIKRPLTTPQRINAWYSQMMNSRVLTDESWKFLGDCTAADLQAAAARRYKAASDTQAEADRFVALAELMKKKRAKTVREIPAADLKTVYEVRS